MARLAQGVRECERVACGELGELGRFFGRWCFRVLAGRCGCARCGVGCIGRRGASLVMAASVENVSSWFDQLTGAGQAPDFTATATASAATPAKGCPANSDAYWTAQNGYCSDAQGFPLRPDGSVMTTQDIQASAVNQFIQKALPFALGGLVLFMVLSGGGGRR